MKHSLIFFFCLLTSVIQISAQDKPIIAIFDLEKYSSEGYSETNIQQLIINQDQPTTFISLLNKMRQASLDNNVKGVVFYGENLNLGMAQILEIQRQIEQLNKAGKKTFYYSQNYDLKNLSVASAVKEIYLFPQGGVVFNGFQMQNIYFKNVMEKLNISADIVHIGDFKSAGEPFYLDKPSKESEIQTNQLLNNIATITKNSFSHYRKIDSTKFDSLVDRALINATDAKKANLVDHLAYHNEFVDKLKSEFGSNILFSRTYGDPEKEALQMNNLMDLFKLINDLSKPPVADKTDKISLTIVEGVIAEEMAEELRYHILSAGKDKTVKGMVVRVNSPGGSALASEVIWQALNEFKKSGKSLIISMGDVAASGGYYISTPGEKIYAENLTITGSIGVVGGKLIFGKMLEEIGINFHTTKQGKHADIFSPLKPFTEEERTIITKSMNEVYEIFKKRVSDGRKGKIKGDLEQLAGGRVYTGNDALKIGLVDKIGGLRDALNEVVEKEKLEKHKIVLFPKETKLIDLLSKELQKKDDDEYLYLSTKSTPSLMNQDILQTYIQTLQKVDPTLGDTLKVFIKNLELMQKERVILISPFWH